TMDILKRLEVLANQCAVKEHQALVRAHRLREQAQDLTIKADLYPDGNGALESAKAMMSDECKRLKALAAKEDAEARKGAIRHSNASRGMLLLGPDETSAQDVYPPDLHDAAIAAGVAFITSERVGPLGETEADPST